MGDAPIAPFELPRHGPSALVQLTWTIADDVLAHCKNRLANLCSTHAHVRLKDCHASISFSDLAMVSQSCCSDAERASNHSRAWRNSCPSFRACMPPMSNAAPAPFFWGDSKRGESLVVRRRMISPIACSCIHSKLRALQLRLQTEIGIAPVLHDH